jgi:hypothetical protein
MPEQYKTKFFLIPHKVNSQMIEIEIDKQTNTEMVIDLWQDSQGLKLHSPKQYRDQHHDEYPDIYHNYRPVALTKGTYPPSNDTSVQDFWLENTTQHLPYSSVWDVTDTTIAVGLKL